MSTCGASNLMKMYQRSCGDRDFLVEKTLIGEEQMRYGIPGGVRHDLVSTRSGIGNDYKFPPRGNGAARIEIMLQNAPVGTTVIREIRPR